MEKTKPQALTPAGFLRTALFPRVVSRSPKAGITAVSSPGLKQSQDEFVAQFEEVIQGDHSKNICINGSVTSEARQLKDQNRKVWT